MQSQGVKQSEEMHELHDSLAQLVKSVEGVKSQGVKQTVEMHELHGSFAQLIKSVEGVKSQGVKQTVEMHELHDSLAQLIKSVEARLSMQLVALGAPELFERAGAGEGGDSAATSSEVPSDHDVQQPPPSEFPTLGLSSEPEDHDVQQPPRSESPTLPLRLSSKSSLRSTSSLKPIGNINSLANSTDSTSYLSELGIKPAVTRRARMYNRQDSPGSEGDERPNLRTDVRRMLFADSSKKKRSFVRKARRSSVRSRGPSMDAQVERGSCYKRILLTPHSPVRIVFDLLGVFTVLYDATVRPFLLAWDVENESSRILSMYSLVFWTLDMVMSFLTGFYTKSGELEMRLKEIAKKYVRGWFPMDFCLVMLDWLGLLFESGADTRRLSSLGRLVRTARIVRLYKVVVLMKHFFKGRISPRFKGVVQAVQIVVFIVWANHLICCMWMGAARLGSEIYEQTWLDRLDGGQLGLTFAEASIAYQYTTALHWSMTQMTPGSMEVFPTNPLERIMNVICLILGLFVGTALISQLSAILVQINMARMEEIDQMGKLRRYLKENGVPRPMANLVQSQIESRISIENPLIERDVKALNLLSSALRLQLQSEVFSDFLTRHPIFMMTIGADPRAVQDLIRCNDIERVILGSGDQLFSAGDPANHVYLVLDGSLVYTMEEIASGLEVKVGAWVCETALWMEWEHLGCLEATVSTVMLKMHVPAILKHMARACEDRACRQKVKSWVQAYMETAPSGTHDLHVLDVGMSLSSVIVALDENTRAEIGFATLEACLDPTACLDPYSKIAKGVDELNEELESGKCAVMKEGTGELLRTVHVVVLKLHLSHDEGFLVQIAAKSGVNSWAQSVALPGEKIQIDLGDKPLYVLSQMLQKQFAGMEDSISIEHREQTTEITESAQYGMRTRYHQITFHAQLRDDEEFNFKVTHYNVITNDTEVSAIAWPVADESKQALYAWLSPSQLQAFQKGNSVIKSVIQQTRA
eukprot:TRINITY_DN7638_c0_g1_i4.p1 TRINITY_DN7638_c0_g1~~TRINITY_DN7638_c0_g1_i4.p1  ORF type:complete len:983 (+),score=154.43 TRINITY_DN7638_c0_g1_i4:61-3009(+)